MGRPAPVALVTNGAAAYSSLASFPFPRLALTPLSWEDQPVARHPLALLCLLLGTHVIRPEPRRALSKLWLNSGSPSPSPARQLIRAFPT